MRVVQSTLVGLLLSAAGYRLSAGQDEARGRVAIKAGKIYTVSGPVIAPGVILIENGKIADVREGTQAPDGATVIDASNLVVIPGLIDSFTSEAGAADAEESIAADIRAVDGYDLYADRRAMLAGGVTTTYVSPGSGRLLSGQGAVVKAAGRDLEARVLLSSHGLRVTLGEAPKNPPGLYKPPIPPTAENPIRPIQRQYPTSRMGEFAALRKFFRRVKGAVDGLPDLPPESIKVARDVLEGRRPLVVAARAADDLIKAILFADEMSMNLILVNADEAYRVADLLAERKIPVLLDAGISPGRRQEGDEGRPSGESRRSAHTAAELVRAGVRVALHTHDDDDMRELLLIAAYAVRQGLPEGDALRAVTLTPAELLGVERRVGSVEKGKDADLVLMSGEPLDGTSVVQRVLVDGESVFERRDSDLDTYRAVRGAPSKAKDILAIKGARILPVTQGPIADGLILIEEGRITYAGRMRQIPPGAKVVDAAGLTAAPGLIDIQSHVGMHLDLNEVAARRDVGRAGIPASTVEPPSGLVRLDDPEFAEVAAAGITTVVLAPDQSGVCSVLKMAGGPKGAQVVREVAALKIPVAGGTAAYKQLKDQLDRARKYHEEWEAWEKAQKEQKEAPKPATTGTPDKPDPITGSWRGTVTLEFGGQRMTQTFTADLRLDGHEVHGSITVDVMGRSQTQDVKGTFQNDELKFTIREMGAEATITLRVTGPDKMDGTLEAEFQGQKITGNVSMARTSSPAGGAAAPAGDRKAPRKDDQLEPYRSLFRRDIPAMLVARDLPAVENAVRVFRDDFNLDFLVMGTDEADFAAHTVARANAGAAFGPVFLRERRGAVANLAEAVASTGVTIAFYSGAQSGTRHLPLQVVHAVRYGLDPQDALKAVTVNPARLLKMDARLGTLERGRDGDVVLYTGSPLSLTSRVKQVFVNGKSVYEAK